MLFGAVVTAEDGRAASPAELGDDVLVGPHAHVNGSVVGDGCFLATGSAQFPGSRLGGEVEVRINGVVHVNTVLERMERQADWFGAHRDDEIVS